MVVGWNSEKANGFTDFNSEEAKAWEIQLEKEIKECVRIILK